MRMRDRVLRLARRRLTPREAAGAAGLRYVDDSVAGISRRARGKGFIFFHAAGRRVRDPRVRRRIEHLAIPPAWRDVWICPHADGHIQATGRDARGRKQYLYHASWRAHRDAAKYDKLLPFGIMLPELRRKIDRHLALPGLPRDKVLATVVALLQRTHMRIGNEEYARANASFGMTTLRSRHVRLRRGELRFTFKGKSGVRHAISLEDRRLARIVRSCQELPGQELFQFVDDDGRARRVDSDDVNAYLRELAGIEISAKDFRTWAGTSLLVEALLAQPAFASATQAKRNVSAAIGVVCKKLGNTKAVCRSSYVHPAVIDAYVAGALAEHFPATAGGAAPALEGELLAFLQAWPPVGRKLAQAS
jgi:DNA topoisomerase-1